MRMQRWRATLTGAVTDARWAACGAALSFAAGLTADLAGATRPVYASIYAIGMVVGGWMPAVDGVRALRDRRLDVDLLMVVAAVAAVALGQWRDGALLIVIFASTGALEEAATRRTAAEIRTLVVSAPDAADLLDETSEVTVVSPEVLATGDRVLVRPGARVPADGVVLDGEGAVDELSLTGEPLPVRKVVGRAVMSGSTVTEGVLVVEVTRRAADSTVARLAAAVEEAIEQQPPTQQFIERFEQRYSVGVVVASLAIALCGPLWWSWTADDTVMRTMTFLVVASPCAVVLATMPATLSALATAAKRSVLVRGGAVLERVADVDVVAFDKTGTLTEGRPRLVGVDVSTGRDADEMLMLAAGAERWSEHPIGRALVADVAGRGWTIPAASEIEILASRGVSATVGDRAVRVGGTALLDVDLGDSADGAIRVGVEVDGDLGAVLALEDTVRDHAGAVMEDLRALGMTRTILVTGDRRATAERVGAAVGVDHVEHSLLPDGKAAVIGALSGRVMYVGDGVNDAAALATASVGVSLGQAGSALAVDTADVVLMDDDLRRLPELVQLARRTRAVVRANLAFALTAIAALVVLDLSGHLPLVFGVVGHEGSSAIVALNGLRLLRWRPHPA